MYDKIHYNKKKKKNKQERIIQLNNKYVNWEKIILKTERKGK